MIDSGETWHSDSNPEDENSDSDELLDHEEKALGTDPRMADTDGDGVEDHEDINPTANVKIKFEIIGTLPEPIGDYASVYTLKWFQDNEWKSKDDEGSPDIFWIDVPDNKPLPTNGYSYTLSGIAKKPGEDDVDLDIGDDGIHTNDYDFVYYLTTSTEGLFATTNGYPPPTPNGIPLQIEIHTNDNYEI